MRRNADSANLRIFCPDELVSNRLDAVFDVTARCTMQSIHSDDAHLSPDGRVLEVLSEHCCEGWLEGYVLTGRHGLFACYEAFAPIVDSMVNQHVKWLKAASEVPWRRPLPALNILLTSHTWRQDHNGYSHQGPGFIDNVLNRKHRHMRVYLAPDGNCLLAVAQHAFASSDRVNLIIAGKQPMPQWLALDDAIRHCANGAGRWNWAEVGGADNPAVDLACAGDVPTLETLAAADLLRRFVPDLPFRVINVVNLLALAHPLDHPDGLPQADFNSLFTADRPVLFAFHGYPHVIDGLVDGREQAARFHSEGYREEGTTTTPFDMVVLNRISRYHLAERTLDLAQRDDAAAAALRAHCHEQLADHALYIRTRFEDLPEVRDWRWPDTRSPGAHRTTETSR
ncbi:xylulose-5-phosphate phosphoketolase [mine drainage metagenome]|uniref:Xylulose-5-phosphate phosphoketolase n=1 Tax=mine drainage metagenome TaxID=410659 RepID=A0A1J5PV23_9ZZZZ